MKIRLGSDLIECLSWSLYEKPIVLFREAIQNSIDAFEAKNGNWKDLLISIELDQQKREITIKDNGPGLAAADFINALGSLGDSTKKKTNLAGCRGIGRLSGLGICDEITFVSHAKDCNYESKCTIDAKGIREGLLALSYNSELSEFISNYVKFSKQETSRDSKSFFTVHFKNIKRLSSDHLLNPKSVEDYILDIAPVPIQNSHEIVTKIDQFYQKYSLPNGICIQINKSPILQKVLESSKLFNLNNLMSFEEHQLVNENNIMVGAAWFIHHDYLGALGKSPFRGLRFRHKNLLIGNEDTFSHLFKEPRFNRWTIGEVHALDRGIRPSVKRDDFEPNEPFNSLSHKIRPILFKIGQLARKSSNRRLEQKLENKISESKPNLQKIKRNLLKNLPKAISKEKIVLIAEDLYLEYSGKVKAEKLVSIFLRAKDRKLIK
jgi:molecular chaperone HtpG